MTIQIPTSQRNTVFLVNRVEGMRSVHYGGPMAPMCRSYVTKPWLTSWFLEDVTCKRCRAGLP